MATKIKTIQVQNLRAVTSLTADFNGCTAIITGGNNKGKSTLLRSFADRMRGTKAANIIRDGESQGYAKITLTTGERMQWAIKGDKEKLTFISTDNKPSSLTKDIMRAYFPPVFDVDAFLNDTPAKQKAALQKISGIDFTDLDAEYKHKFEQRTWANRVHAEAKAKATLVDPTVAMELVSVEALADELNAAIAANAEIARVTAGKAQRVSRIAEIKVEIDDLNDRITALRKQGKNLQTEVDGAEMWLGVKLPVDDAAIRASLASAEQTNNEIRANLAAAESQKALETAERDAEDADAEVKRIEAEKADTLKHSNLPDGFGFTDDGITYNGHAFDRSNLSSSAIYIAALKLASLGLGEVKTLHFDASYLDRNSLAEIETWANGQGLQLLIERPDFDGGEIRYELIAAADPSIIIAEHDSEVGATIVTKA